jgi:flagellar biogenesis protein FliO
MRHDMQPIAVQTGLAQRCNRAFSAIGRFLAARFLGKTQAGVENALRVEEKLSLGPKKMLYLVRCREKEFLIAAGADAIVSVVEVSSAEPAQIASAQKASVSRMQKRERLP